jgi:hypothetical protein
VVHTNDPANRSISLTIKGQVDKFAEIIPDPVLLTGRVGETIKKAVRITPGKKYPFTITDSNTRYGANIKFSLDKKNLFGKKAYLLTVENTRNTPGRYMDFIYLTTDSQIQPRLTIKVRGNIYVANTGNRSPSRGGSFSSRPGAAPDRPTEK